MDTSENTPSQTAVNIDGINIIPAQRTQAAVSPQPDLINQTTNNDVQTTVPANTPSTTLEPTKATDLTPISHDFNTIPSQTTQSGESTIPNSSLENPQSTQTLSDQINSQLNNTASVDTPVATDNFKSAKADVQPQPAVAGWPPPSDTASQPVTAASSMQPESSNQTPITEQPITEQPVTEQTVTANLPTSQATVFSAGPDIPNGNPQAEVFHSPFESNKKRGFNKKILLTLVLPIFLLFMGGASATYFLYIVPNKPENIWAKAMSNTGKAYDKVSNYITDYKTPKANSIDGTFKASGAFTADGSIKGQSDGSNSDVTANFSTSGMKISAEVITIKSQTDNPDIYLKVSGIKGLGDLVGDYSPQYKNTLNSLDGQWYSIDHSLLDQFTSATGANTQIKREDVNDFIKKIDDTNKKYLFSNDNKKAVLVVKQNIGKESFDGITAYHFKTGYNKANLKSYLTELCNNFKSSKLGQASQADSAALNCSTVGDSANDIKDTDTADVWVDMHTKLIHTFRLSDKSDPKNNYFDIGQSFTGGSEIPLFIKFHSKEGTFTTDTGLTVTVNMKTNAIKVNGNLKTTGGSSSENETASLDLSIIPSVSQVKITKPKNSKSLLELMNDLGFGELLANNSGNAKDVERNTDIKAVASHLEVYNAQHGYYPTLANLDDAGWRTANLKGLDKEATRDPDGKSYNFAPNPSANIYAYKATNSSGAACNNTSVECTKFILAAILSDGKSITVNSLN